MAHIEDIKKFCLENYKHDDFINMLEDNFGGEIVDTGGGMDVWLLCYDGANMVSVSEESLMVTIGAINYDMWYELSTTESNCDADHTIYFYGDVEDEAA